MSSYIYRKKPNPVVDHNLYELISNPTTFGYNTPVGGQLAVTNFFEVLNADEDIIGFLWFDFYSDENMIEINLAKSLHAAKFQGFSSNVLSDLDRLKSELPQEWITPQTQWLGIVKPANKNYQKITFFLMEHGFQNDGEDGFVKSC